MTSMTFAEQLTAELSHEPTLPSDQRHAAVALIFWDVRTPRILMIERTIHPQDPWSGQMAFPGGKAEENDHDLQATARRETLEEVGIDLRTQGEFLGNLQPVRARRRGKILPFSVVPYVYRLKSDINGETVLSPDLTEVAATHWIPLDHLITEANHTGIKYQVESVKAVLPAIAFGRQKIWGLSYLMLTDLVDRLRPTAWFAAYDSSGDERDWSFWKRYPRE